MALSLFCHISLFFSWFTEKQINTCGINLMVGWNKTLSNFSKIKKIPNRKYIFMSRKNLNSYDQTFQTAGISDEKLKCLSSFFRI